MLPAFRYYILFQHCPRFQFLKIYFSISESATHSLKYVKILKLVRCSSSFYPSITGLTKKTWTAKHPFLLPSLLLILILLVFFALIFMICFPPVRWENGSQGLGALSLTLLIQHKQGMSTYLLIALSDENFRKVSGNCRKILGKFLMSNFSIFFTIKTKFDLRWGWQIETSSDNSSDTLNWVNWFDISHFSFKH